MGQRPYDGGVEWPMTLVGSIAAFILLLGIAPPYPEIWKRRGRVVGISKDPQPKFLVLAECALDFVFLAMDSLGAGFSLFALGMSHQPVCVPWANCLQLLKNILIFSVA